MRITPQVLSSADEIGEALAERIVSGIAAKGAAPYLLGCPSGRTATPVYAALARLAERGHDLSRLIIVMMDDYVIPDGRGGYRIVDPDASYSCLGFARRDILAPLVRACQTAETVPPLEIWTADPADPGAYDDRIEAAGGIDFFLLASGDSDGHVAFNQPGTPRTTRTHLVELGEATRRDNMSTFPGFTSLDMVPSRGVTVGVDTIARLSRAVGMIVTGTHKQEAFARITAADAYDPSWPATIVTECREALFFADLDAAAVHA